MPQAIELAALTDYTGGLNFRASNLQLADNESPDLLNVDVDPRGGFAMRNVATALNSTLLTLPPQSVWSYSTTTGTKQLLVNCAGASTSTRIFKSTGADFTAVTSPAGHVTAGAHRTTTFDDVNYIQNGTDQAMKYDGTTLTALTDPVVGGTWDADFASPTTGEMPIAKCIATHQGSVFVANTSENGTAFPNRVRFSHPGHAQAWRSQDFIDVDTGHDGDVITAILSFGERLLIFKNKSLHVISGYSPANFQVSDISQKVGAVSQEAVCASEDTVYFFSWPYGAYKYTSSGLEWIFERIYPEIQNGHILGTSLGAIKAGYVNQRVWFSVVYKTGTTGNRVYVYDPTLWGAQYRTYHKRLGTPQGAWVQYDLTIGAMHTWSPPGSTTAWVACHASGGWLLKLEQAGDQDAYGYAYLSLASGVSFTASAPNNGLLAVTSDLDIGAHVALDDWTPAAETALIGKWTVTGNQRSYYLIVDPDGTIALRWSPDGHFLVISATSTVAPTIANGTDLWVRATLDVDNGASGYTATFYTSVDGINWVQLGDPVVGVGTTSIFASTALATVAEIDGGLSPMAGKFYSGFIKRGIGGTIVANPNFGDTANTTATTTVDTSVLGSTWTISGSGATLGGSQTHNIASYYTTKWEDLGNPAQFKRWKRPEFVVDRAHSSVLTVQVFKDYDPSAATSSYNITPDPGDVTTTSLWGANWGTMVWNANLAAAGVQIQKGAGAGRCRAIALKVNGPATSVRWAIQGVTLKYVAQRIRS